MPTQTPWQLETAPSVTLAMERFGEPGMPAILLISGAGAPGAFWPRFFCEGLVAQGFQVIRFDHRDTGFSTHLDAPYGIDALLQDVWRAAASVEAKEVHLAGHSMGGYLVALALTVLQDDRIATGTAISAGPTSDPERYPALGMTSPTPATWERLVENTPIGAFEADVDGWMTTWRFLNGTRVFEEELAEAYTRALYQGDPRNAQMAEHHVHAMTTVPSDLPERLRTIDRPLLVVHGTEDPLVPFDNGLALHRLTPNAGLYALEGAGHMIFTTETWREIDSALADHIAVHA